MQQRPWQFSIKQGTSFHCAHYEVTPSSTPPIYAHLFLRQSNEAYFYMQIYTGCLGSQKIFSLKKLNLETLKK